VPLLAGNGHGDDGLQLAWGFLSSATVTLTGWASGTSITSNTVTFAHPSQALTRAVRNVTRAPIIRPSSITTMTD